MSKLVIVESPAKAKTIQKYLPGDFDVRASYGHIRDLPDNKSQVPKKYRDEPWAKLGVDTEHDFEAVYVVQNKRSRQTIKDLKKKLKDCEELYLATDEDREGEAISWHLVEELSPKVPSKRMVFHEITRTAIEAALEDTRDIDDNLVAAQETRRILDRLVGYPLSLLVSQKISYGLSAGRVQSVALRLLVERERERRRFKIGTYWDLKAQLDEKGDNFEARLRSVDGTRVARGKDFDETTGKIKEGKDVLLLDEDDAQKLQKRLVGKPFSVENIKHRSYTTSPKAPFITSTLQQEANRKLGLSAGQTMSIAQDLYENGFITYHRTDSVNLSKQATDAARDAARGLYGSEYVRNKPRNYSSSTGNAQEAHEAIRPTGDAFVHPEKSGLSGIKQRLYDLIWKRTVACQMADAKKTSIKVDLGVKVDGHHASFRASGTRIDFPGFIRAYVEGSDDPDAVLEDQESLLPELDEGQDVDCTDIEAIGHETRPPRRFTEASLVKELEEQGVGRPSTYASILDKITRERGQNKNQQYALQDGKTLIPTYLGFAITELLEEHFEGLVNTNFTARMEGELDAIARGEESKVEYLHKFYREKDALRDQIERGEEEIDKEKARTVDLEEFPATLRVGRYGAYVVIEEDGEEKTVDVPDGVAPADLDYEKVIEQLRRKEEGPTPLGTDPDSGEPVYLKNGRYGWYLQLGERNDDGPKPKTASVPDGVEPENVDLKEALKFLSLPREIGNHPEDNNTIEAGIGRYGPYVRHTAEGKSKPTYASLNKIDEVFEVGVDEAVELLKAKRNKSGSQRNVIKDLGEDPDSGDDVRVLNGRYGPYVKAGKTNASLPDDQEPKEVTLEQAMELIQKKRAK